MSKYVREIMSYPNLTKEETEKLIFEKNCGNECARELLIIHNLKIVAGLVNEFQGDIDLSDDELINIGAIGLVEAVNMYEEENNIEFSKYVYIKIRSEFNNYLNGLNKIDGNIYENYDQLNDKTISFNEDKIGYNQNPVEHFVLNRIELEERREFLAKLSDNEKEALTKLFQEPTTAIAVRPKQYIKTLH